MSSESRKTATYRSYAAIAAVAVALLIGCGGDTRSRIGPRRPSTPLTRRCGSKRCRTPGRHHARRVSTSFASRRVVALSCG